MSYGEECSGSITAAVSLVQGLQWHGSALHTARSGTVKGKQARSVKYTLVPSLWTAKASAALVSHR